MQVAFYPSWYCGSSAGVHVHRFSQIFFKLGEDISCLNTSHKFNHGCYISLNMCKMEPLMTLNILIPGRNRDASAYMCRRHCVFGFSVHPSERFPGIILRMNGRNGLKFGLLMYADHLQNWQWQWKYIYYQSYTDKRVNHTRFVTYNKWQQSWTMEDKHGDITTLVKGAEVKTYVPQVHVNSNFIYNMWWAGNRVQSARRNTI